MFQDIVKLIQLTLIVTLEDKTKEFDKKQIYDVSRVMQETIKIIQALEVHYLPLSLEDSCLQNSHYGTPFQKWLIVLEQDFDKVRQKLRQFFSELTNLTYKYFNEDGYTENISIMQHYIKAKDIFGYFSYHYESGKLSNDGRSINYHQLYVEQKEFYKECVIDITTYEQRIALCEKIRTSKNEMKAILDTLKSFLLQYATLEELL